MEGWTRFDSHACALCKQKHAQDAGLAASPAGDLRIPDSGAAARGSLPAPASQTREGKEDADDLYVKIGCGEEGEEEAADRAWARKS